MARFLPLRLSRVHYGLLALAIAVLAIQSKSILVAATNENSLYYTSEAGRFDIMMPMPISLHEQTLTYSLDLQPLRQPSEPSLECHQLGAKDYGAVWFVIYCDFPLESLADLSADQILDNAREATFYNNQPSLIEEKALTYHDQFPGRELLYQVDADGNNTGVNDTYSARTYLVDNRLYWVGAMVTAENQDDRLSLIQPFLESFYIETNPT